ncbi:MAG: PPC domain-containing protein [Planctomycetaceae bacterium]|jgi:hypothetical protein|nr:PPC domain-containing protein [Planctomycetaceae bacterium]
MKRIFIFVTIIILLLSASIVFAQSREPKIAYVYPAGGQRGTTFEILLGGRMITKPVEAIFSGKGVHAKIVKSVGGVIINDQAANQVARNIYDDAKKQIESDLREKNRDQNEKKDFRNENSNQKNKSKIDETQNKSSTKSTDKKSAVTSGDELVLPSREEVINKYLYFDRLTNPSADDVQFVFYEYFSPRPAKRPVEGMTQGVVLEVTIDADAEVGERDLRLFTSSGMTKPVRFIVGEVRELCELEPNDFDGEPKTQFEAMGRVGSDILPKKLRRLEPQELPITFNGQIRNGDVDRFSFKAEAGRKIVISVQARQLSPYLADAVPGWFQAAITLFDSAGKKITSASSYRFNPDPAIFFEPAKSGVYSVEIQDSVFRGRDDFVYRLSIGESVVVTSIFPLGGKAGTQTVAEIDGWNLPTNKIIFDTDPKKQGTQTIQMLQKKSLLYPLKYVVDVLPELTESESNDGIESSQKIETPVVINGRIDSKRDVDYFSFAGKLGETIIFDAAALSLEVPLDLGLEVLDAAGKTIAENDDWSNSAGLNIGLVTHRADPYLEFRVPADGEYFVRLFNIRQEGGKEFSYRFSVTNRRNRIMVYTESSTLHFQAATYPIRFFSDRRGGFDGEAKVRIAGGDSKDFILDGAAFRKGSNEAIGTITVKSREGVGKYFPLAFETVIKTEKGEEIFPVIVSDDFEQAFIYHHLVPTASGELFIVKPKNWQLQASLGFAIKEIEGVEREKLFSVTIIPGGRSELILPFSGKLSDDKVADKEKRERKNAKSNNKTPQVDLSKLSFVLSRAPKGVTLEESHINKNELRLVFAASESIKKETEDDIIIEINLKSDPTKPTTQSLGTLPIIKCKIK